MAADSGARSAMVAPDHRRKLIAVVYADMAGYSRLIGHDDAGTFERLQELRRDLIDPSITRHGGTLVNTAGDSLLVTFDSIIPAMRFAVEVQRGVPDFDGDYAPDRRMRFRMGVNVGDVIPDGTNLHGEGVNIAARLQSVCPPGDICVSRVVRDHVGNRLGLGFKELGAIGLKNIARPTEAFLLEFPRQAATGSLALRFRPSRRTLILAGVALVCVAAPVAGGLGMVGVRLRSNAPPVAANVAPPRLSVVVLPFQNLSGNPAEDYLVDGITDDLTTDLSHIPEAFVIARESAYTYKGKATDVRQIGRELGVRYVLEGSVRKIGTMLRVNAQLVSAETGLHLWSDRFDEDIKDLAEGQERVVARMFSGLGINMVEIESKRSQRERPTNPDAFDLILQARALRNQPFSPQRQDDALALFERALLLDPESASAMANVAYLLLLPRTAGFWPDLEVMVRAEKLISRALTIAPTSQVVLRAQLHLLRVQERWQSAIVAAQQFIEMFPNDPIGYAVLGFCKTFTGNAEQGIALAKQAIHIDPRTPYAFNLYFDIGYASLMLGRDADAIASFERSLALNPLVRPFARQNAIRMMSAAHARMGADDVARRELAEANRLFPFDTARGHRPEDPTNAVYAQQVRNYQDGLRRAGLRDHADEDADFGVPADAEPHQVFWGLTPTTVPGARTIRTGDLVALLAERKPLVIDLLSYFWGKSIPRAVGLKEAGAGGSLSGPGHDRLRRKIAELTGGDLSKPIVAVGWNSQRFDGRNLALRLVAMGYTDVYWYRGGREAWEVNGLPETELTATDW